MTTSDFFDTWYNASDAGYADTYLDDLLNNIRMKLVERITSIKKSNVIQKRSLPYNDLRESNEFRNLETESLMMLHYELRLARHNLLLWRERNAILEIAQTKKVHLISLVVEETLEDAVETGLEPLQGIELERAVRAQLDNIEEDELPAIKAVMDTVKGFYTMLKPIVRFKDIEASLQQAQEKVAILVHKTKNLSDMLMKHAIQQREISPRDRTLHALIPDALRDSGDAQLAHAISTQDKRMRDSRQKIGIMREFVLRATFVQSADDNNADKLTTKLLPESAITELGANSEEAASLPTVVMSQNEFRKKIEAADKTKVSANAATIASTFATKHVWSSGQTVLGNAVKNTEDERIKLQNKIVQQERQEIENEENKRKNYQIELRRRSYLESLKGVYRFQRRVLLQGLVYIYLPWEDIELEPFNQVEKAEKDGKIIAQMTFGMYRFPEKSWRHLHLEYEGGSILPMDILQRDKLVFSPKEIISQAGAAPEDLESISLAENFLVLPIKEKQILKDGLVSDTSSSSGSTEDKGFLTKTIQSQEEHHQNRSNRVFLLGMRSRIINALSRFDHYFTAVEAKVFKVGLMQRVPGPVLAKALEDHVFPSNVVVEKDDDNNWLASRDLTFKSITEKALKGVPQNWKNPEDEEDKGGPLRKLEGVSNSEITDEDMLRSLAFSEPGILEEWNMFSKGTHRILPPPKFELPIRRWLLDLIGKAEKIGQDRLASS